MLEYRMNQENRVMEEYNVSGMGSEGCRRPTGDPIPHTETEVVVPGKRRRYTKAYKLSVLDRC